MDDKLATMLRHRGRSSQTVSVSQEKRYTSLRMADGCIILAFHDALKKSDIQGILDHHDPPEYARILVTAPSLSRMAGILADDHGLESISCSVYAIDRLSPVYVPRYTIMSEADIGTLERAHRCSRRDWPTMLRTDPIAQYLGLRRGACVRITNGDIRVVK